MGPGYGSTWKRQVCEVINNCMKEINNGEEEGGGVWSVLGVWLSDVLFGSCERFSIVYPGVSGGGPRSGISFQNLCW